MKNALLMAALLIAPASFAKTFTCTNQTDAENQRYPSQITVKIAEKQAAITVDEVDENSTSLASVGITFKADRAGEKTEPKAGQPVYFVKDGEKIGAHYEHFANDERDTAIYMYVDQKILDGKAGKITFWLHYNGGDYQGVDSDDFSCK